MVHDMIQIEKMGKPAIPIVSGRFEEDAIASSRASRDARLCSS